MGAGQVWNANSFWKGEIWPSRRTSAMFWENGQPPLRSEDRSGFPGLHARRAAQAAKELARARPLSKPGASPSKNSSWIGRFSSVAHLCYRLRPLGVPVMENTFVRKALLAVVLAYTTCAQAQWLNHPDPRIPRTRDGKPNLMAPTPRASNDKPDLSGVWQAYASEPGEMLRLLQGPAPRRVNQIEPGIDLQTFS